VPEGDTLAYAAKRIRPVLEGRIPEEIRAAREPKWPERLGGRAVQNIETFGKHLFLNFDGGLVVHSHLGMVGSWAVLTHDRIGHRARLVMRAGDRWVVQFGGPTLELLTNGRARLVRGRLGPDVLAEEFDRDRFLRRLRAEDPTRPIGDALLDQTTVAGIGNIWKAEGCWEAGVDPWRPVARVSDEEVVSIVDAARPRMMRSADEGPRTIQPRVYGQTGRPCPRCGSRVRARGQGDANRTTYWCPGCQR
jgi:endonuclease-8